MSSPANQPMGNQPESAVRREAMAAEAALQSMTQDLKNLQQTLLMQMAQDIARLQSEKSRLMEDVDRLRSQQQQLQSQQIEALTQRQVAQQRLWAKQLAQAMAMHLQDLISQRFDQWAASQGQPMLAGVSGNGNASASGYSEHAHQLLASLDNTFNTTFKALQRELETYESSLSQQLNRMHGMEQQSEAILQALLERLREQLETQSRPSNSLSLAEFLEEGSPPNGRETPDHRDPLPTVGGATPYQTSPVAGRPGPVMPPMVAPLPEPPPVRPAPSRPSNQTLGLWLVIISTLALSLHNVVVGIIGFGGKLFGQVPVGPFISLVFGNSVLILLLRVVVVIPLLVLVAPILHPTVWRDVRRFLTSSDRRPIAIVLGSGVFLFLSQVLIYIAIAQIGPGVAVTILFMYPILTVPLAGWLLNDKPTLWRYGVMAAVTCGVVLTAFPALAKAGSVSLGGILIAVGSGVAFAFYLIFMQLGFRKLPPVPVSLLQFCTIFFLAGFTLLFAPIPEKFALQVDLANIPGILVSGLILGVLTLVGYLTNNFSVRLLGAAQASIIASSGPVITALLAVLITPSPRTFLQVIQVIGIMLVTVAVASLSLEKLLAPKPAKT